MEFVFKIFFELLLTFVILKLFWILLLYKNFNVSFWIFVKRRQMFLNDNKIRFYNDIHSVEMVFLHAHGI